VVAAAVTTVAAATAATITATAVTATAAASASTISTAASTIATVTAATATATAAVATASSTTTPAILGISTGKPGQTDRNQHRRRRQNCADGHCEHELFNVHIVLRLCGLVGNLKCVVAEIRSVPGGQ
jgi:Cu/Zn superoxide dismutase